MRVVVGVAVDLAGRIGDARVARDAAIIPSGNTDTRLRIAGTLNISDNTVRHHVNNIMEKLQVTDRTEAVTALRNGVLSGND